MAENPNQELTAEQAHAQLRYLQSIYSQQHELLQNEIATFSLSIGALQRNIEMLENRASIENSSILINGEGGAYIEANIKSVQKAVVYVGAGYLVEKTVDDAMLFLKENQQKQEEGLRRLLGEKEKIEKELLDISYRLSAFEQ